MPYLLFSRRAPASVASKSCSPSHYVARAVQPLNRLKQSALAALAVSLIASSAQANPELISTYDSRAAGMAGSGVAFQTNGAAPVHNSALLSGIDRLSVTATFTPYALQLNAPFTAVTGKASQVKSKWSLGPLAQLGVGVRVHKRVTVGVAAFLPLGLTSTYEKAPLYALKGESGALKLTFDQQSAIAFKSGTLKPMLLMAELIIPVSVDVFDWLSVAAAYRMTYANQSLTASVNGSELLNLQMSAKNFAGYDVGVWFHPIKLIHAGLSFRSQIDADYKAELTVSLPNVAKATKSLVSPLGTFSAPHLLKGGVAVRPLGDKLMATGEFRYYFYEAANVNSNPVQLNDSWTVSVGLEARPVGFLALRIGGGVGSQATPRAAATPFSPPPGKAWIATVGAGVKVPFVDIDLAVGYGQEGTGTTTAPPAASGTYNDQAVMASVSANFHL